MSLENKISKDNSVREQVLYELEIKKRELEIEKIKVETSKLQKEQIELSKKWYSKPQWWSVIVPFVIGAGTILIAFLTGIISVERLKNEKDELTKYINLQKDSINYYSNSLHKQRDSLIALVKLEQVTINNLSSIRDSLLSTNRNQKKTIKQVLEDKLKRVEEEIYMYEDHSGIYNQLDEVLNDSISKYDRQKKLIELYKVRSALQKELRLIKN